MLDAEIVTPSRLSWSSVSTYSECGNKWLLTRGFKVPEATWFATIAGSVIHEITEAMDRAEVKGIPLDKQIEYAPSFASLFEQKLAEVAEKGKEVKPSGRVLKAIGPTGGPNKKDKEWWLVYGPIFVERWLEWKKLKGWRVAIMPDGNPGIELKFEVVLGGVPVLGYIDRVYLLADGTVACLDLKTGMMPTGSLQLATYAVGLREQYGLDADWGIYWTPGTDEAGKMSQPIYIKDWSFERISRMYSDADRGIRSGIFLPQVTNMCVGCTVRSSCWAVAGEKSKEIPMPIVLDHRTGEVVSPISDSVTLINVTGSNEGQVADGESQAS